MPSLLAAISLLGGGLQALGEVQQGQEAYRTGQANHDLLIRQAALSMTQQQQQEYDLERRATIIRGAVIAGAAGQGTTTSGSVAALLSDNARQTSLDHLRIIFDRENNTVQYQFQAEQALRAGAIARSQSQLAAFGALLGAGGRALQVSRGTAYMPNYSWS